VAIDPVNFEWFERLGENLGELEVTIGPVAQPVVAEIRARLAEAAARHNNRDTAGAIEMIRGAMERLASLAGTLDPAEATLMRTLGEHFSQALRAGDKQAVKGAITVMRHKAGDPKDDPNRDW
jgi:hypothetical protein